MTTPAAREFSFTQQDFDKIRKLIYDYAGIALTPAKQDMVYGRLAKRLRHHKLSNFNDYLSMLERGNKSEWEAFINSLTTNLTSFFREAHHFDVLLQHLKSKPATTSVNIWCAASSTGEEPYSLAITACEAYDSLKPPVRIIATDIDTQVLRHGETGIYPADVCEKLGPQRLAKFFSRLPDGQYQAKAELRSLISFQPLNLIAPNWVVRDNYDAIFCRNVMIYFDRETQLKILERFAPKLKADGLLFVGHSENLYHAPHLFKLKGKTVYELQKDPPPARSLK